MTPGTKRAPAANAAKPSRRKKASAGSLALTERETIAISRAIADPRRFEVLRRIAGGGARCSDLRECLPISAATLSHHMKELESAGLIEIVRQGKFVTATLRNDVWQAYLAGLQSLG